ncbi:hypothetical protein CRG98_038596 [Punica granatum]|uniref:Uncharacterized protein n=1 Tax=Punica granatum TaxID=22663 RepID=A0A2I0IAN7_PUNGR|nr:hypothetical protein CRG98_038596 [Punica granatum]
MFNFGGCTTQKLRKPGTSKKSKGGLDWSGVIALDKVELGEGHDIVGESRRTVAVLGLMQAKGFIRVVKCASMVRNPRSLEAGERVWNHEME